VFTLEKEFKESVTLSPDNALIYQSNPNSIAKFRRSSRLLLTHKAFTKEHKAP